MSNVLDWPAKVKAWFTKAKAWVIKVFAKLDPLNPCSERYSEDSLVWKIMSILFPDCWCCAGIRGVVYGVVLMSILWVVL